MTNSKISIIIPVYKVEKYIRECIESVLAQTMKEIEIIVVNDGTPDHSADIVREYAAVDDRIKIIDQPNQGVAKARNAGLKAVTAALLMFVDADDVVEPDFCQKMFDALTDDADVALCWTDFIYDDGIQSDFAHMHSYKIDSDYKIKTNVVLWNKIFRIDIIRKHMIEFPGGLKHEDQFFWYAYLPWCRKITVVKEYLYHYRIRKDSIMGPIRLGKKVVSPDLLRVIAELADYYDRHGLFNSDTWTGHFWWVFDRTVRMAQKYRPKKFTSERGTFRKIGRFFKRTFSKNAAL